jgi:transposase
MAYSTDLRQRVVEAYEQGKGSIPEVAAMFSVSPGSLKNWMRLKRESGSVQRTKKPGGRHSKLDAEARKALEKLLEGRRDAFLAELREEVLEHLGVDVSRSTLSRVLRKLRQSRKKKSRHAAEGDEDEVQERALEYLVEVSAVHADNLVTLDEIGMMLNLSRDHGWAPVGERVHESVLFHGGGRHTLLAAMDSAGLMTEILFEGYLNTELWRLFVRDYLVRELHSEHVVLLDNLQIHKDRLAEQMIQKTGARLLFLPPYCPELNPIELCWSKFKGLIRSRKPRSFDELVAAVCWATPQITAKDARGWYRHCGFWECSAN